MPGWLLLNKVVSKTSGDTYEIRRGGDGVLYCQSASAGRICQGWLSNKNTNRKARKEYLPSQCKHTKEYVAETGASYGPQYETEEFKAKASNPAGTFKAGQISKPGKPAKQAAVPQVQTTPAPKNWKDIFLAEAAAAAARGLQTPAAAMAEFTAEIGRFANLDMGDEVEVVAAPVKSTRALDVE